MRVFLPLLFRKAKSNIDAKIKFEIAISLMPVSYTHLRAHETREDRVCPGQR